MNIGIVGLGLIGGSLAKAYTRGGCTVYGGDRNKAVEDYAIMCGASSGPLAQHLDCCDYLFIALYPAATIDFLRMSADKIKKGAVVVDCCGVKRSICQECFAIAAENDFHFVGGHPMAGTQFSGFKHSRADLFDDATMLIVPRPNEDIALLSQLSQVIRIAGFASVATTNANEHDRIIAFSSQLAHVVSNAYIKSPTASNHHRFSAGSYRDLTRVAKLDENMWSELFLENADNLTFELDLIIARLREYREAINSGDRQQLCCLLREGREKKEEIDTEWKE